MARKVAISFDRYYKYDELSCYLKSVAAAYQSWLLYLLRVKATKDGIFGP